MAEVKTVADDEGRVHYIHIEYRDEATWEAIQEAASEMGANVKPATWVRALIEVALNGKVEGRG